MKRLRIGRLSFYIEPRDIWIGAYIAPAAVYVCPLPLLVIKWDRRMTFASGSFIPWRESGTGEVPAHLAACAHGTRRTGPHESFADAMQRYLEGRDL